MINLTDFIFNDRAPAAIVNRFSDGGVTPGDDVLPYFGKSILSGTLTADTLKEILSVTGAGRIKLLAISNPTALAHDIGLKVMIDGVTCFDAVNSVSNIIYRGFSVIGFTRNASYGALDNIYFNSSLSVSVSSSVNGTDKINLIVNYEVFQ